MLHARDKSPVKLECVWVPRRSFTSRLTCQLSTPRDREGTFGRQSVGVVRDMNPLLQPMLASLADAPLDDPQLVYEPKYDGIRAIAEIAPKGRVHLWSRLGNDKTRQFPEITAALETWARRRNEPLVLDGEIVALDGKGEPTGFQQLQGRIHVIDPDASRGSSRSHTSRTPGHTSSTSPSPPAVAFIAFDILRDGRTDLRDRPLVERKSVV